MHWRHHHKFCAAVHAVVRVSQRLDLQHSNAPRNATRNPGKCVAANPTLLLLPPALWFCVCGWLLRRDWTDMSEWNRWTLRACEVAEE